MKKYIILLIVCLPILSCCSEKHPSYEVFTNNLPVGGPVVEYPGETDKSIERVNAWLKNEEKRQLFQGQVGDVYAFMRFFLTTIIIIQP